MQRFRKSIARRRSASKPQAKAGSSRGRVVQRVMQPLSGKSTKRERRRLAELFASLGEGKLREIAGDANSLTLMAGEALRTEMLSRWMEAPAARSEAAETSASDGEDPGPIMVGRFRNFPEALVATSMLDSAGIPSILRDENLVRLDWF
jgi:hypothetical protein